MFVVSTAAGRIAVLAVALAVLVGCLLWSKRATSHSFFLGVLAGTGLVLSFDIEEHHRIKQIRGYLEQIERLNLATPGGLRSQPVAEAGEDQELVNEAWNIFCARRRGGGSRFG